MKSSLVWTSSISQLYANHPTITIFICTDGKSLCKAFSSSNPRLSSFHDNINSITTSIFFRWISGCSSIQGNKLGESVAKETTTIAANTILHVSLPSSSHVINEKIRGNTRVDH